MGAMKSMDHKAQFANNALSRSKGRFAMKNTALDFKAVNNSMRETRRSLRNGQVMSLDYDGTTPLQLEGNNPMYEETNTQSNDGASNIYEEFSFDVDDERMKEESRMGHEQELERIKLQTVQAELEKLTML